MSTCVLFLSQDPLGHDSGDDNYYRYVGNNPLSFKDPDGEDALDVLVALEYARKEFPDLPPDTSFDFTSTREEGSDTSLFSNRIHLKAAYALPLNEDQRDALLRTIFHEVQHVRESRVATVVDSLTHIGRSPHHRSIYRNAEDLLHKYGREFRQEDREAHYYERKYR